MEDAITVSMNRIVLTMDVADWRDVPLKNAWQWQRSSVCRSWCMT
jgi:hypothetical protein